MGIKFTKMHGLGNDFMVIDAINQKINLKPKKIESLARRDTGIGFDQCLLIEKSNQDNIDFFYRIFNSNGEEVGQCGNGARCIARFINHYGMSKKNTIRVATITTQMELLLNKDDSVTVEMGKPKLYPTDIPIAAIKEEVIYELPLVNQKPCKIHALSIGNPHAIMLVSNIASINVNELGKEISLHSFFPEKSNVSFMQIINKNHISLRVYERGAGETKACGSAATAAAIAGMLFHNLDDNITVSLPGGDLLVTWPKLEGSVFLKGPATFVYEGRLI